MALRIIVQDAVIAALKEHLISIKIEAAGRCTLADASWESQLMTSGEIARRHLNAALTAAGAAGVTSDALCRSLLGLVVAEYLKTRSVSDVQSELRFVAENCDPDTDHIFMRP